MPPATGGQHVLRVVRDVLCHEPVGAGTDLRKALELATRSLRKRAIVFLISDFLTDGSHERALRVAARKHDVVAVCVSDPREAELPRMGLVEIQDAETGARALVDTSDRRVRDAHRAAHLESIEARDAVFRRIGVDAIDIRTDRPYDAPIMAFFRTRERKARLA